MSTHDSDTAQALLELTAVFENTAIGIVFTCNRVVRRCNRRAAEIFGYADPHNLIGKPAAITYPDAHSYERISAEAGPLLAAGRAFHGDWLFRKADGSELWCNVYAKAVDPGNSERGTVWVVDDITEARRAAQALRHSAEVLEDTLQYMDQGITIVDDKLIAQAVNRRFGELYGFPMEMCKAGTPFEDFVRNVAERGDYGPGDVEEQVRTRVELAKRFEPHRFERERSDGTIVEVRGIPIPGGRGFVTVYTDITQRARAERALRESEARFRSLTALSSDWYWEQDEQLRYARLEGRHASGDASAFASELGKTDWELGFEVEGGRESHIALLAARQPFHEVVMHRCYADGVLRYVRISGEPIFDAEGRFAGYRGVGRDITPQKLAEERIQYLATHDGLTGLPNRLMFMQLLGNKIQNARRYGARFAVMFMDLDHFKVVNDTYGHEAGDALLKEMAARFSRCLRASDVVARLGGDEFVVLVQEVSDDEQVATVARKLLSAAILPVSIHGKHCRVGSSIGICTFPHGAADEQALMRNADTAMYRAKALGKNNFQFYAECESAPQQRLAFEAPGRR